MMTRQAYLREGNSGGGSCLERTTYASWCKRVGGRVLPVIVVLLRQGPVASSQREVS